MLLTLSIHTPHEPDALITQFSALPGTVRSNAVVGSKRLMIMRAAVLLPVPCSPPSMRTGWAIDGNSDATNQPLSRGHVASDTLSRSRSPVRSPPLVGIGSGAVSAFRLKGTGERSARSHRPGRTTIACPDNPPRSIRRPSSCSAMRSSTGWGSLVMASPASVIIASYRAVELAVLPVRRRYSCASEACIGLLLPALIIRATLGPFRRTANASPSGVTPNV